MLGVRALHDEHVLRLAIEDIQYNRRMGCQDNRKFVLSSPLLRDLQESANGRWMKRVLRLVNRNDSASLSCSELGEEDNQGKHTIRFVFQWARKLDLTWAKDARHEGLTGFEELEV